jgi:hypothetical protein
MEMFDIDETFACPGRPAVGVLERPSRRARLRADAHHHAGSAGYIEDGREIIGGVHWMGKMMPFTIIPLDHHRSAGPQACH